jgi:hypothetical protein
MALEKLMPCLPLFVRTSQLMNSSIRLNFANTAIVCLQSDDALNPGQPEQSVLPLGKIFTIWGFRGSDEDATTNVSLDWFVIASGVVIRVIALSTMVETSARGIQSMPPRRISCVSGCSCEFHITTRARRKCVIYASCDVWVILIASAL